MEKKKAHSSWTGKLDENRQGRPLRVDGNVTIKSA
jgi:hypothetical protein